MKIFNSVFMIAALGMFTACGSNTPSNVGINPYATSNGATFNGTQTGSGGYSSNGYNTQNVPGGTKTLIPVLVGTVSSYGTKVYSITQQVAAGDQIIVNASGSLMYAIGSILGGFGTSNSSGYLSGLTVSVNGQTLGTSLYATYNVPAAGTLSLEGQASILNIAHTAKTTFTTVFAGGVMIAHCVSTAGAAMPCPAGY